MKTVSFPRWGVVRWTFASVFLAASHASAQTPEWTQRHVAPPSNGFDSAMAHDGARGVSVLFGGTWGSGYSDDTWEWDGVSWSRRMVTGPAGRSRHALAYDSARGMTVLFGGWGTGADANTWEWDGTDSHLRSSAGPSARVGHTMAYDSARGVTVMFGGNWGSGYSGNAETWEWSGIDWTLMATSGPPRRYGHAMAYDSARGVTVMFGGVSDLTTYGDTWEWDGTDWVERAQTGPSPRTGAVMVYDERRGATVMFGGQDFDELWEWDGTDWTLMATGGPLRRDFHAMTFDSTRGVSTLHRGSETWEFGVFCPPVIDVQPQDQCVVDGDSLVFETMAAGHQLSYQWFHDGNRLYDDGRITGAMTSRLSILSGSRKDMGGYSVTVSSTCGDVDSESAIAILAVRAPEISPPGGAVPVEVSLTSSTIEADIYYTLDGTDPSPVNGLLYSVPLLIDSEAMLRAAAFAEDFKPSRVALGSYRVPQIVYVDPEDIPLDPRWGPSILDLDLDGVVDVYLTTEEACEIEAVGEFVGEDGWLVSAVPNGESISPASEFVDGSGYFGECVSDDWPRGSEGFAGVRFDSPQGGSRYGWIRIRMPHSDREPGAVLDWAYQAAPETGILAGDTGECRADLNGDGQANTRDFVLFLHYWAGGDAQADWNGDDVVNTMDFLDYLNDWNAGC